MKHKQLKTRALSKPEVNAEYNALEPEFLLLKEMLIDRENAGLCQAEAVIPTETKAPGFTRSDSPLIEGKSNVSRPHVKRGQSKG